MIDGSAEFKFENRSIVNEFGFAKKLLFSSMWVPFWSLFEKLSSYIFNFDNILKL